ncbi:MAG: cytochrome c biogenesis protein ResB [Ignavibacteriales bacterium]|nr:cytochrome c biogenesis protein ResB [Ignavibacteriales bacterium]
MIHKKFQHIILSRSTALLLISSIGILSLIGLIIPQISATSPEQYNQWKEANGTLANVAESLNLNGVFTSEIFFVVISVLLVVVVYSLFNLYLSVKRSDGMQNSVVTDRNFKNYFAFLISEKKSLDIILEKIQKKGFVLSYKSDNLYSMRKNPISRWGTTVFHLGLTLIIITGLGTYLFQNRGFVQLLERDTFFGVKADFLNTENGMLAKEFTLPINVSLQNFSPEYYSNGDIKSLKSSVLIGRDNESPIPAKLSINEPYEIDGVKIYQSTSFGYTIGLNLEIDGQTIPAYFSLDHPGKLGKPYFGTSDFPTTDYILTMKLIPDPAIQSFELKNPELYMEIFKQGEKKFSGNIKPGESIKLENSNLTFSDIRFWSGLIVTKNPFVPYAFIGFGLILIGLVMVYVFPTSTILISVDQVGKNWKLAFGGVARREKAIFDYEFNELIESLYIEEGVLNVGTRMVEV